MMVAWTADHYSPTGEIRQVSLPDGTQVWLDTASAFDQDFRSDLRRLRLLAGEILVATAHAAPGAPFVVDTAQGRMRALGTRFTVRLEKGRTFLAVYQGAVQVDTLDGAGGVIPEGRQTAFTAGAIQEAMPADPAREAWTRGELIAQDLPLRNLAAELNRYTSGHIGVAPEVAQRRVFGTFPLRDVNGTLSMLAEAAQVRARRVLPWWTILEAADDPPPPHS